MYTLIESTKYFTCIKTKHPLYKHKLRNKKLANAISFLLIQKACNKNNKNVHLHFIS